MIEIDKLRTWCLRNLYTLAPVKREWELTRVGSRHCHGGHFKLYSIDKQNKGLMSVPTMFQLRIHDGKR